MASLPRFGRHPARRVPWALLLVALLWASLLLAFPARTGWVTDGAGALTPREREALHQELDAFEKRTGFEVAVVVVRSLEGKSVEDYSYELAKTWKVGKAGKDNGVMLLLAMGERKSRIETGKGVGHLLTDVESADILDRVLKPRMKAGKVSEGLTESVRAIQKELSGSASPGVASPPRPGSPSSARSPRESPGGNPLPWLLALGAGGGLCYGAFSAYRRRQQRLALAQQQREAVEAQQQALQRRQQRLALAQQQREVVEAQQQALDSLIAPDGLFQRFSAELPFSLDRSILGDYSSAILAAQRSLSDFRENSFSSRIVLDVEEKQLTSTVRKAVQELRRLENLIKKWTSCIKDAPRRVKVLCKEMEALEAFSSQGSLAWKDFLQRYPNEDAGTNPDALVFEARSRVGQLALMTSLSDISQIEALLEAEAAARGALRGAMEAISRATRLQDERQRRWKDALAREHQVQKKVNSQRLLSVGNGRNPLANQGEDLFREGKAELDRRDLCNTRKALDFFTRAEPMLAYVAPVVSSYSSYDSGSSSSYSSSSYDSSSSSNYSYSSSSSDDSSSSSSYSSYDSGSSSSYDSGSSSDSGGGDYGGGGSSGDW